MEMLDVYSRKVKHCRLHRYGMGIHLLQRGSDPDAPPVARPPAAINPKGNHISFQVKAAVSVYRLQSTMLQIRRPRSSFLHS
jgi:hypothetical protein